MCKDVSCFTAWTSLNRERAYLKKLFLATIRISKIRVRTLLDTAYQNAEPEEKKALVEAMRDVSKGDHYIAVMTAPALARATRGRDILLYLLIGAVVVTLSLLYSAYR